MVVDDTLVGYVVLVPRPAKSQAQIHILATVDVLSVEPSRVEKNRSADETTRRGHGSPPCVSPERTGPKVAAEVKGRSVVSENNPQVIISARARIALDVADEASVGESLERTQHRFEPAGGQYRVII